MCVRVIAVGKKLCLAVFVCRDMYHLSDGRIWIRERTGWVESLILFSASRFLCTGPQRRALRFQ